MSHTPSEELKFSWWDTVKALYYLLDDRRNMFFLYTTILVLVLFYDLVPIFVVAKIVDFFTSYTPSQPLELFYGYVLFLTITYGIISLIRLTVKKKLANIRVDSAYFTRVKGFERLLDFSIKWHDNENTGNKVQKIQAGSDAVKQIQNILAQEVFMHLTGIIGVFGAFLLLEPTFFVISALYVIIFLSIQMSFYKRIEKMNYENNILLEKAGGTYFEGLNNILTIKTLGVKNDFKKNINNREESGADE